MMRFLQSSTFVIDKYTMRSIIVSLYPYSSQILQHCMPDSSVRLCVGTLKSQISARIVSDKQEKRKKERTIIQLVMLHLLSCSASTDAAHGVSGYSLVVTLPIWMYS